MRFMFITIACFIAVLVAADRIFTGGDYLQAITQFECLSGMQEMVPSPFNNWGEA